MINEIIQHREIEMKINFLEAFCRYSFGLKIALTRSIAIAAIEKLINDRTKQIIDSSM